MNRTGRQKGPVRPTMTQAVVRWLTQQPAGIGGQTVPLLAGVVGVLGHGSVILPSEGLFELHDVLPTRRGQNDRPLALAAIGSAAPGSASDCEAMSASSRDAFPVRKAARRSLALAPALRRSCERRRTRVLPAPGQPAGSRWSAPDPFSAPQEGGS
jgi:hypothetical protein